MAYFRHPKTQNERKQLSALKKEVQDETLGGKLRKRSRARVRLNEAEGLPTERSDMYPAARLDRARGKPSHSPARKAKDKARDQLLK